LNIYVSLAKNKQFDYTNLSSLSTDKEEGMKPEANDAFNKIVANIKAMHQNTGGKFKDLRIAVRTYSDEKFQVTYFYLPTKEPLVFSWPREFEPKENEKVEKVAFIGFTEQGKEAPVTDFSKMVFMVYRKYLERGGQKEKFIVRVIVSHDIFTISVFDRQEDLNQIAMCGMRKNDETFLPIGDGDYLVHIRNGNLYITNFDLP
jgi:hypothetical protein